MLDAVVSSLLALTFVVVPLDDRPVSAQLPQLLGAVAGVQVVEPPRGLLGRYLTPGDPDALARWLRDQTPADTRAFIVSNDMMIYGGLVASRVPGVTRATAYARISGLAAFRATRPLASFALFGTVMRLAPTGVPSSGAAASFPFAGAGVWGPIAQYANLPDPPQTAEQRTLASTLRRQLGPVMDEYLDTRARDRDVDLFALRTTAEGGFDRIVLGQDDAGPVGLHLRDLSALRAFASRWLGPARASIEPGADELAMALESSALARASRIAPRVRVVYSRPDGNRVNDPLEFVPISATIADLARTCGATIARPDQAADVDLYVKVPNTPPDQEGAFADAIAARTRTARVEQRAVAVADLSFLAVDDYAQQRALTDDLIARGAAGSVDAFASWNTVANTVGTALPEAVAVLAGRKLGTYDASAHARFTLMRYIDDVAFHTDVRPQLNAGLSAAGILDHTYLPPDVAADTASRNRALLWRRGLALMQQIAPQFRAAGFTITLPWARTFETELDLRLAPAP